MIRHTFETDRFPAEARQTVLDTLSEDYRLNKLKQTKDTVSFQTQYQTPLMHNSGHPQVHMTFEETPTGTRIHSTFSLRLFARVFLIIFIAFAAVIQVALFVMTVTQTISSLLLLLLPVGLAAFSPLLANGLLYLCTRRIINSISDAL